MLSKSIFSVKKQNFKQGDNVILYNREYKNVFATIKDVDDVNKIAVVLTADGETHRVDYQDMSEYKETPDFSNIMNQSVESEDGYRPVGKGTGKDRDALNVVGQALNRLEKELHAMHVPIIGVKYESTVADKWHNGLNTLWMGNVNFNIEFLDTNGQKHSATIKVPIQNGLVQKAEYVYDNLNRKFHLTAEGIQDMLKNINYIEESEDASVYDVPGSEKIVAEKKSEFDKKSMYQKFAQTPWRYIKHIVQDEVDREKLKELLALRDLIDVEIRNQEDYNEQRGLDRAHKIDYKRKNRINTTLYEILDRYEGGIKNHFYPDAIKATVDKVIKSIKIKTGADQSLFDIDEEMVSEKEKEETVPGKKKKTHQRTPDDKKMVEENVFNTSPSSPSSGMGTRDMNDVTMKEPSETQFTR